MLFCACGSSGLQADKSLLHQLSDKDHLLPVTSLKSDCSLQSVGGQSCWPVKIVWCADIEGEDMRLWNRCENQSRGPRPTVWYNTPKARMSYRVITSFVSVSLGFFDDIVIPSDALQHPSRLYPFA